MNTQILKVRVGSRAWGTDTPESDTDYLEVYLPPVEKLLGFAVAKNKMTNLEDGESTSYSLREYLRLMLAANPNVFPILGLRECDVEFIHPWFQWMMDPKLFLSKRVRHTFKGYANQMKDEAFGARLPKTGDLGEKRKKQLERYGYVPKAAAHALRAVMMGREILALGKVIAYRDHDPILMNILAGEWSPEHIAEVVSASLALLDEEAETSTLPEEPQTEQVEQLMVACSIRTWGYAR